VNIWTAGRFTYLNQKATLEPDNEYLEKALITIGHFPHPIKEICNIRGCRHMSCSEKGMREHYNKIQRLEKEAEKNKLLFLVQLYGEDLKWLIKYRLDEKQCEEIDQNHWGKMFGCTSPSCRERMKNYPDFIGHLTKERISHLNLKTGGILVFKSLNPIWQLLVISAARRQLIKAQDINIALRNSFYLSSVAVCTTTLENGNRCGTKFY
jgi:hypothetical protein